MVQHTVQEKCFNVSQKTFFKSISPTLPKELYFQQKL